MLRKLLSTFLTFSILTGLFFLEPNLFGQVFAASSISWSQTSAAGGGDRSWRTAAMDSDGSVIIAGVNLGRLYLSTDSGDNWSEVQPAGDGNEGWYSSAVSNDGQIILAGANSGRLYISTDSGENWSETQPLGNSDASWATISISDDGQTILAGNYGGRLYITTDGGDNWSQTQPAGNVNEYWFSSDMGSGGENILVGAANNGRLYITTDGGDNWSETRPVGDTDADWYGSAISDDGNTVLAADIGGGVYLSTNGGTNWIDQELGGDTTGWRSVGMSDDGTKMLAAGQDTGFYNSFDGGASWSLTTPAGSGSKWWWPVVASRDGTAFVAGIYDGGGLYIGSLVVTNSTITSGSSSASSCTEAAPVSSPNLFRITSQGLSSTLYFAPASGVNSSYVISYGTNASADMFTTTFDYSDKSGVIPFSINDLYPGKWYFKVRGQNGCMPGNWSQIMGTSVLNLIGSGRVLGATSISNTQSCKEYIVNSGDNLWNISSNNLGSGTKFQEIMEKNGLVDTKIMPGQKLKIGC